MTLTSVASDHVALARLSRVSRLRIARDHLTPPVLPAMIVMMTAHLARAILATSGLRFLGFGVSPLTPEWGVILLEARVYTLSAPGWAPGVGNGMFPPLPEGLPTAPAKPSERPTRSRCTRPLCPAT